MFTIFYTVLAIAILLIVAIFLNWLFLYFFKKEKLTKEKLRNQLSERLNDFEEVPENDFHKRPKNIPRIRDEIKPLITSIRSDGWSSYRAVAKKLGVAHYRGIRRTP